MIKARPAAPKILYHTYLPKRLKPEHSESSKFTPKLIIPRQPNQCDDVLSNLESTKATLSKNKSNTDSDSNVFFLKTNTLTRTTIVYLRQNDSLPSTSLPKNNSHWKIPFLSHRLDLLRIFHRQPQEAPFVFARDDLFLLPPSLPRRNEKWTGEALVRCDRFEIERSRRRRRRSGDRFGVDDSFGCHFLRR